MPSNYLEFAVTYETTAGVIASVGAAVDVAVRAVGEIADSADSPLTTISGGIIEAGTLSDIAAGTVVHFRVENYNGMAMSIAQTTT